MQWKYLEDLHLNVQNILTVQYILLFRNKNLTWFQEEKNVTQVFTDGYLFNGRAVTAFVSYEDERELPPKTFRLTNYCSLFQVELFAIKTLLL